MTSGGARNRSGPPVDPGSGRSDRRGLSFVSLPAAGFDGTPPEFSLPGATTRELEVWAAAWKSPQAAAWFVEPWRWRTVEQWVRMSVRMEDPDSASSLVAGVLRMADQIGLSPAGLKENGWVVAVDEVAARREVSVEKASPVRRLRAVASGD